MLRDIPKVYVLMFLFIFGLSILVMWYMNNFQRDGDTLQLNDAILSSAIAEVDQTSRLYQGALLLADTFEPTLFERLTEIYTEGDTVQIDYMFDIEDDRFDKVEDETISSPTYTIGGSGTDIPQAENMAYMMGHPVESVRVKVHEKGDRVGKWTYTSTITVDAASKGRN